MNHSVVIFVFSDVVLFTPTPSPTDVCPPCKSLWNSTDWVTSLNFHGLGSLSGWMGLMIRPDKKATAMSQCAQFISTAWSHTLIARPYPPPVLTVLQYYECEVGCPKTRYRIHGRPSLGYFNWINDFLSHDQPTWNPKAEEEAKDMTILNLWIANGFWTQWLIHFNRFSYLQLPFIIISVSQVSKTVQQMFLVLWFPLQSYF